MIPSEIITVTSLPVIIVSIATIGSILVLLALCACGKSNQEDDEPHLTDIKQTSADHLPEVTPLTQVECHPGEGVINGGAAVPLTTPPHNNTTSHSRGNSVDLNRSVASNRHSGASTGSSPRPATICRTLPDIPVSSPPHHGPNDSSHSRSLSGTLIDIHHRPAHAQLPSIPHAVKGSVPGIESQNRHFPQSSGTNGNLPQDRKNAANSLTTSKTPPGLTLVDDDRDDYDHIDEKKKMSRPRSDYDHVVVEGELKIIIPAKSKIKNEENDYAEVQPENIYEGVADDVVEPPQLQRSPVKVGPPTGSGIKKSTSIDDPYNKIRDLDPPYNKIKDDPYNKIKGDDSFRSKQNDFDPYNKVKGDLVDDLDPYDDVKDTDSVSTTGQPSFKKKKQFGNIDPYSFVEDEERNVSNQTDPYARVVDMESEIDDPYNKVSFDTDSNSATHRTTPVPDYNDDDYASVNKSGIVEYAKVNKSRQIEMLNGAAVGETSNTSDNASTRVGDSGSSGPRNEIMQDEYATVVKVRTFSARSQQNGAGGTSSQEAESVSSSQLLSRAGRAGYGAGAGSGTDMVAIVTTPPEPPRGYMDQEGGETDHYNTVVQPTSPVHIIPSNQGATGAQKKEPPYNKLSVRESLASMNARIASNTYEYVSEVDNLYATVEGSSGDGVVTCGATSTVPDTTRLSNPGELYSEIDAPAPPSLDSLHETAKTHQEEIRRKVDPRDIHDPRPGQLDYYNIKDDIPAQRRNTTGRDSASTSQHVSPSGAHFQHSPRGQGHIRTPSNGIMTSSLEGRASLAMEENTDLDNDPPFAAAIRRSLVDSPNGANDADVDPDYETVEEAKAKLKYEEIKDVSGNAARSHIYEEADDKRKYEVINGASGSDGKIRAHVYEEVTVTNEARRTRQRVLNAHTYEEVTDQVKDFDKKSGKGSGDVKKKKGHERTSSGEHWFSKKKSGDSKDKDKNAKKKSEDKDHKK